MHEKYNNCSWKECNIQFGAQYVKYFFLAAIIYIYRENCISKKEIK